MASELFHPIRRIRVDISCANKITGMSNDVAPKGFWAWCRRYMSVTLFIVVAFIVMVLFFNENSMLKSIEYNNEIIRLKREIRMNRDTLDYYRRLNQSLDTDPETMERIVREYYHMQRENEDVYIFDSEQ